MTTNFVNWGGWSDNQSFFTFDSTLIQYCNNFYPHNYPVFGGYNMFAPQYDVIKKKFINLPDHVSVNVELNVFLIDTWDNEYFYVDIDNINIISIVSNFSSRSSMQNECGGPSQDVINQYLSGSTPHTSSSMTISFHTNLEEASTDESYGFKDLKVFLTNNCHFSCIDCYYVNDPYSCSLCPSFAELNYYNECICKRKYYMEALPYTHCEKCDISCMNCNGPSPANCTDCYNDYNLVGGICKSPTSNIIYIL